MKLKTIIIISLTAFFMGFHVSGHAQETTSDAEKVFQEDPGFEMEKLDIEKGDMVKGFLMPAQTKNSFRKITPAAAKKMGLPYSVRVTNRPITLKYKGNCYQFGCQASSSCKDCRMFWMDKNGDRKVQPRRELRCMCSKGKKCRIRVRRVKCD